MEQTKHRFNIVDFLIIVLVIAAVVSVIQRANVSDVFLAQERVTVEYSFILENIRDTTAEYFAKDTDLFFQSNEDFAGKLVEFSEEPYEVYITLNDGSIAKTTVPEKKNITGKIRVEVKKTEDGYFLEDNYFLAPGCVMYLKFDMIFFSITVLDVKEVNV